MKFTADFICKVRKRNREMGYKKVQCLSVQWKRTALLTKPRCETTAASVQKYGGTRGAIILVPEKCAPRASFKSVSRKCRVRGVSEVEPWQLPCFQIVELTRTQAHALLKEQIHTCFANNYIPPMVKTIIQASAPPLPFQIFVTQPWLPRIFCN